VQLGFGEVKPRRISGGELGHLKKADVPPLRFLREFRVSNPEVDEGQKLTVEIFALGDHVDVVGTSKGKGFAGAVKRHGFRGGPKTHGQSDRQRATGAISAGTGTGRVFKGKRMPGHMGNVRVTSQNLKVVYIDTDRNLLAVMGSVPGPKGGLVMINEARKQ
jgi:large subunit ribosomal protein L3